MRIRRTAEEISKRNAEYNKARQDKMNRLPCWDCQFFGDHCDPFKKCRKELEND